MPWWTQIQRSDQRYGRLMRGIVRSSSPFIGGRFVLALSRKTRAPVNVSSTRCDGSSAPSATWWFWKVGYQSHEDEIWLFVPHCNFLGFAASAKDNSIILCSFDILRSLYGTSIHVSFEHFSVVASAGQSSWNILKFLDSTRSQTAIWSHWRCEVRRRHSDWS